jgi:uridine phosphorylase
MAQSHSFVHAAFRTDKLAVRALVVGDPRRATEAAGLLENPLEIWNRREYRAYSGSYGGRLVTICSHGVGAGGAAYLFENLLNAGVRTIIRAGTCGSMMAGVGAGALMIGTAAVRGDGASSYIAPIEYPAVADHRVVAALVKAAAEWGYTDRHAGLILTDALFFSYPSGGFPGREQWAAANVIAIENEWAALLVQAAMHRARAGGLFVADANVIEKWDPWVYHPDQEVVTLGKKTMLKIALNALVTFDQEKG